MRQAHQDGVSAVLYTPQVLALAASLADFPLHDGLPLRGEARSASCGSRLTLGLAMADGAISAIGISASACAVGQAAAALFAAAAPGNTPAAIKDSSDAIAAWLAAAALGEAIAMPDWPGLSAISAAARYPARHGAVMLAWKAAIAALSSAAPTG